MVERQRRQVKGDFVGARRQIIEQILPIAIRALRRNQGASRVAGGRVVGIEQAHGHIGYAWFGVGLQSIVVVVEPDEVAHADRSVETEIERVVGIGIRRGIGQTGRGWLAERFAARQGERGTAHNGGAGRAIVVVVGGVSIAIGGGFSAATAAAEPAGWRHDFDQVGVGQQTGEQIVTAGVGLLRGDGRAVGDAVVVGIQVEVDGHVGQADLAVVNAATVVGIVPDQVAQAEGQHRRGEAEVLGVVVVAGALQRRIGNGVGGVQPDQRAI